MLRDRYDKLWHGTLKRPFKLVTSLDHGEGPVVVLLHGIGSSGNTWQKLPDLLGSVKCRLVAFDLLGFGNSPKPQWANYSTDQHARSVISAIKRIKARTGPIIIVGHSMGSLVAVRIARLQPNLVKHLILYEMPVYAGLPDSRRYKMRRDLYFRLYERIANHPPIASTKIGLRKAIKRITGLNLDPETWLAFTRSLRATIMEQQAMEDIAHLNVPIDVIYGSLDVVVIRGKPKQIFSKVLAPLKTHTITQMHSVSLRSTKFIARRIKIALSAS